MPILLALLACLVWCFGIVPTKYSMHFLAAITACVILYYSFAARWKYTKSLMLALSGFLFAAVLGDISLRWLLAGKLAYRAHDRLFEYSPVYDEEFRYKPNAHITHKSSGDLANFACLQNPQEVRAISFKTDSYGFRNDREADAASPIQILVLGDSFGVGVGMSQEDTWWNVLSARFDDKLYNLSLPGNPRDEAMVLKRELPRLQLAQDAVMLWLIFEGNDLDDTSNPQLGFDYTRLGIVNALQARLANLQHNSPIRRLVESLSYKCKRDALVVEREVGQLGNAFFLRAFDVPLLRTVEQLESDVGWLNVRAAMNEVKNTTDPLGLRIVVAVVPTKAQVYFRNQARSATALSAFAQLVQIESKKHGFDFVDLAPLLRRVAHAADTVEPLYWREDTHWNRKGHRVIAVEFGEIL